MKAKLKELGLETAVIDSILGELNGNYIPKERFDQVNEQKNELQKQSEEYQAKVDELSQKAGSSEELQSELATLKEQHEKQQQEYENKIKQINQDTQLDRYLDGKVHDLDYVKSKIDREALEFDDNGKIVTESLENQFNTIKEASPFIVKQEQAPQQQPNYGFKVGVERNNPSPKEPTVKDSIMQRIQGAQTKQ